MSSDCHVAASSLGICSAATGHGVWWLLCSPERTVGGASCPVVVSDRTTLVVTTTNKRGARMLQRQWAVRDQASAFRCVLRDSCWFVAPFALVRMQRMAVSVVLEPRLDEMKREAVARLFVGVL